MVDEDKNFTPDVEQTADAGFPGDDEALKNKKKSRLSSLLGYGTLLLVLLLVGAGVFLLQELRSKQEGLGSGLDKGDRQMQELLHQISGLQTELAAVHSQLATAQSQLTTENSKFERQIGEESASFNDKLEALRTDLGGSIQHLQRQMNQTRGDIMVADAEYLLSVANQKLHLVGDVKAVIAMMEAADQRLHDSGDPAAFKVREALAEEINLLKGFNPPDVVGVSAKLLAMEVKVKDLPLFLPHSDLPKEDHQPVVQPEAEVKAKGMTDSILKDLKSLVTVRHTDRSVQSILLPEEVAALRQILLLKLETSRSALLRGDDELYRSNMDSALAWLGENFDTEAASTLAVIEELKSLRGLQLQIPFPDVSKSLSLLRNIENLRLEAEKSHGGKQEKSGKTEAPLTPPPAPEARPAAEPQPETGVKP
ncbi:MAG: uroporphyrinogen-III C-methyltransferase [Methylococcaceae bacterium]|nr:uroporphyrinogen-III C-methyltransferase [Methylococcaceae bacterium]